MTKDEVVLELLKRGLPPDGHEVLVLIREDGTYEITPPIPVHEEPRKGRPNLAAVVTPSWSTGYMLPQTLEKVLRESGVSEELVERILNDLLQRFYAFLDPEAVERVASHPLFPRMIERAKRASILETLENWGFLSGMEKEAWYERLDDLEEEA